jgi:hypothetical protein
LDAITETVTGPNTTANTTVGEKASAVAVSQSTVNSSTVYAIPPNYVWEGIIGNTSERHSGPSVHVGFRPMAKMVINPGTTEAFYTVGYNEGGWDVLKFDTDHSLKVTKHNIGNESA